MTETSVTTEISRPRKRKSAKGERRRCAVLDALLMVASERGMDGASVGTVAEAAGIPKSLILYHFGSRERLLEAAVSHAIARIVTVRKSVMSISGEDPREQLRAWISSMYAQPDVLQAWCFLAQITARTSPGPGLTAIADFEKANRRSMRALIQRGNDEFCWQVPSAQSATVTVLALFDGLRMSMLRAGFDADLDKAASSCRRAILDYLVR